MSQSSTKVSTVPVQAGPIVKWAGGKKSLLQQYQPHFPPKGNYNRYFEPFLGGGAIFFYLQPAQSFLFDLNSELIELYQVVRDNVEDLIGALKKHRNEEAYFYRIRAIDPAELTPVEQAARFIFLNRTCYNGLYRVNRRGQFNVPFGRYDNPTICAETKLRAASMALRNAQLKVADFSHVLELAQAGDLVYFDPPYEPLSPTSNFTSYTSNGFSSEEQRRLAGVFRELDDRGCLLMLSNSTAGLIHELYTGFQLHEISARRAINSKAERRGLVKELLVTNFPPVDLV